LIQERIVPNRGKQDAIALASSNKKAYSVAEFCDAHCISRALFYLLQARGDGPRIMKAGKRTLISVDAAQEWCERMERKAAV
jgi:hypothetical protein